MISDLYGGQILEAAANIPAKARLPSPDASAQKVSRICGSQIDLDMNFMDGLVSEIGLDAQACALGQAATSITIQNIIGAVPEELYQLRDEVYAMLKEDGPPPSNPRWHALEALQAIRDYPQRHASTLLIFDAIVECLTQAGFRRQS